MIDNYLDMLTELAKSPLTWVFIGFVLCCISGVLGD